MNVISWPNGFSSLFNLKDKYKDLIITASTDGVGTKLKLAFQSGCHDTIGICAIAMNANDLITCGSKPLFALDYIATNKNIPEIIEQILLGIKKGCELAKIPLVGGETAFLSNFYKFREYDIAAFCVGIVEKDDLILGKNIKPGNLIIGLESSGLHSNGFTLVNKILSKYKPDISIDELLTPTRIYVNTIEKLLNKYRKLVNGIANITSGGLIRNIPRILPEECSVKINKNSWQVPSIFTRLGKIGKLSEEKMFVNWNMGIGMVLIVERDYVNSITKCIDIPSFIIGEVIPGNKEVFLIDG